MLKYDVNHIDNFRNIKKEQGFSFHPGRIGCNIIEKDVSEIIYSVNKLYPKKNYPRDMGQTSKSPAHSFP
ncbi:hypothetical protein D0463_10320 [Bacillus sp. V59.32b]|nr:hypothetical protein D0463_10320 [Bacillus sp. V59.32b]